MPRARRSRIAGLLMACLMAATPLVAAAPAAADDAQEARALVERSRITLESFLADRDMGRPLRSLLRHAEGVVIYPQVLKGAFVFGASGGSGVFLARQDKTGPWHGPAFCTLGQVSFGLQAGGAALEVVLVAMTHRGVAALLSTSTQLGANVGLALGPVGAGAEAGTQNLSADIISYARLKGVYGGFSMQGAVVATRANLNAAYYGKALTPTQIIIQAQGRNPTSKPLIAVLAAAAAVP
jgi:lipid-binding SYLF domain-containing protein